MGARLVITAASNEPDHYETLGVSRSAGKDEIRKAFVTLIRKYGDQPGETDLAVLERARNLRIAFDVLGDPKKRRTYDRSQESLRQHERQATTPAPLTPDELWKNQSPGVVSGGTDRGEESRKALAEVKVSSAAMLQAKRPYHRVSLAELARQYGRRTWVAGGVLGLGLGLTGLGAALGSGGEGQPHGSLRATDLRDSPYASVSAVRVEPPQAPAVVVKSSLLEPVKVADVSKPSAPPKLTQADAGAGNANSNEFQRKAEIQDGREDTRADVLAASSTKRIPRTPTLPAIAEPSAMLPRVNAALPRGNAALPKVNAALPRVNAALPKVNEVPISLGRRILPPQGAVPKGSAARWVTSADYPDEALVERRSGTTRFHVTVGSNGKAANCRIIGSSGSPDLDKAACKNIRRRARFRPAMDSAGNPTSGSYSSSVLWVVPED